MLRIYLKNHLIIAIIFSELFFSCKKEKGMITPSEKIEKEQTFREQLGLPKQDFTPEEIEAMKQRVTPIEFETVEEAKKFINEMEAAINSENQNVDSIMALYPISEQVLVKIETNSKDSSEISSNKVKHYNEEDSSKQFLSQKKEQKKKSSLREQLGWGIQTLTPEEIEEIKRTVKPRKFKTVEDAKRWLDSIDKIDRELHLNTISEEEYQRVIDSLKAQKSKNN